MIRNPFLILEECRKILRKYNIEFDNNDIWRKDKKAKTVLTRALIVFILKERGCSLVDIGALVNRDHSTVIYLLNKYHPQERTLRQLHKKIIHDITVDNIKEKINFHRTSLTKFTSLLESELEKIEVKE